MRYTDLKYDSFFTDRPAAQRRTAERLRDLKAFIRRQGVPPKDAEQQLLLATWNIRDFGSARAASGYGERTLEALYYIAETISAFDLVALQEVNGDLSLFEKLVWLLGPDWDWIATDTTEGDRGNFERMVFVFDRRKVRFRNIAGEITLRKKDLIGQASVTADLPENSVLIDPDDQPNPLESGSRLFLPRGQKLIGGQQFARTPFLVAFQAGWFRFNLCTVHIYFGSDSGVEFEERVEEIGRIAAFFAKRVKKEKEAVFLLGDFNIPKTGDRAMAQLTDNKFVIPEALKTKPSNMFKTKHYDQIAYRSPSKDVCLAQDAEGNELAGVLDLYDVLFRANTDDMEAAEPAGQTKPKAAEGSDFHHYYDDMPVDLRDTHDRVRKIGGKKVKRGDPRTMGHKRLFYAAEWRTYHLSDHLPMWAALKIDFSGDYLDRVIKDAGTG